ncbi:patatin-like phospholipase family protein [Hymenobacter sp. HSC-4F20]|uniref:patatin-like phospholipase family protein n=1 Tax=Hymenobacter sp. HSC-4F20 TaxID=2864135 RepID=UPI001C7377B1|nr:patatin-like phospholipase family protein [Hymenobacter sp. HSC-4F20]MBX0289403.1 patatin-like phospholipase family protein [Hymenobacter sp. HSC-4F20]
MLGLALSGGGARGIAHLGVLAALDELQLPIGHLAGVSSGAIAGAFYASGVPPREILRLFQEVSLAQLTRISLSRYGLLRIDGVGKLMEQHLGPDCTFEQLRLPLTLVATDIAEGTSVHFSTGPLIPPLLASSAVPVLYRPVVYQGRHLVDGGLLNNLPVEALLGKPGLQVVGVHCNPPHREARITTLRGLIERTLNLAVGANTVVSKQQCRFLIEPPELGTYRMTQYKRAPELFDIGYRYTMSKAPELEALLHDT